MGSNVGLTDHLTSVILRGEPERQCQRGEKQCQPGEKRDCSK
jgi:hypothetical protein